MLIPTMSRREQRMTLSVMQEYQRAASQNCTQPPNQATRNQCIAVDRFAVSIDIEEGRLPHLFGNERLPQASSPFYESVGEHVGSLCLGHLRKKSLDVPIPIGA